MNQLKSAECDITPRQVMLTPANRKCRYSVVINSIAITIHLSLTVQTEFQSHNFYQTFANPYFKFNSWGWVRRSTRGTSATAGVSIITSDDKWTRNIRWNWNCAWQVYSERTHPNVICATNLKMTWAGIEPGPPQWEAPELWHGQSIAICWCSIYTCYP
jgi:hypothetical protein